MRAVLLYRMMASSCQQFICDAQPTVEPAAESVLWAVIDEQGACVCHVGLPAGQLMDPSNTRTPAKEASNRSISRRVLCDS